MKAIPCNLIINSRRGYQYAPKDFPSINSAVKYARKFKGGSAWRLYDSNGTLIRRGFCDTTPWNGYRGI